MDQSEDLFADNSDEEFIENVKKKSTLLPDLNFGCWFFVWCHKPWCETVAFIT